MSLELRKSNIHQQVLNCSVRRTARRKSNSMQIESKTPGLRKLLTSSSTVKPCDSKALHSWVFPAPWAPSKQMISMLCH
jgi:hypothetical protein